MWRSPPGPPTPLTGAFGDVVQQQRVLGEALHFGGDDVLQLQTAAAGLALRLLGDETALGGMWRGHSGVSGGSETSPGGVLERGRWAEYLYELAEAGVLALLGLELLQGEGLAAAEARRDLLEPAALRALELGAGGGVVCISPARSPRTLTVHACTSSARLAYTLAHDPHAYSAR